MPAEDRNQYAIKIVEHALDLLEAFSETGSDLGVTQLSVKLGMHKSRVFKLLATLEQRGYVERGQVSGSYRAGLAAYETGRKFLHQVEFLRIARPAMQYLARACNEAAYLAIADRKGLLLLERVDPVNCVQISPLIGRSFPSYQYLPGRMFIPLRLEGYRSTTMAPVRIAEELFVDRGVLGEGVFCLTGRVLKEDGLLLGAVCLIVPEFRVSQERMEKEFLPHFREAARILTTKLSYLNYPRPSAELSHSLDDGFVVGERWCEN